MAFPALACLLLQTSLADGHVRTPHPNGFMFINSGYIVVYRVPNGCVWVKKKKKRNLTSRRRRKNLWNDAFRVGNCPK
jgi:hypothetical protein